MKTVKINYPATLLLIIVILAPLAVFGTPREGTEARPLDDQPWGGEINVGDYETGSINSTGYDPHPGRFGFITIRNFGTPLVLIDYLRFLILDNPVNMENSSTINQINTLNTPESRTSAPSPIRSKRFSIRKGR
ncbi:MAG: hypothetical protein DRP51_03365 [Candidatus Zixiibacteriota bacterium]|nr:MAG: hypothetical protein DRP51_03365 [candidate division Zixibacteria bacterium]HHI02988.1 hypothetical protein [candidate division Zixibacteria bacterium]